MSAAKNTDRNVYKVLHGDQKHYNKLKTGLHFAITLAVLYCYTLAAGVRRNNCFLLPFLNCFMLLRTQTAFFRSEEQKYLIRRNAEISVSKVGLASVDQHHESSDNALDILDLQHHILVLLFHTSTLLHLSNCHALQRSI